MSIRMHWMTLRVRLVRLDSVVQWELLELSGENWNILARRLQNPTLAEDLMIESVSLWVLIVVSTRESSWSVKYES